MANQFGMTDIELAKLVKRETERKAKERRYWAEQKLYITKAKAAGITVSEKEIDTEVATMKTKRS